MRNVLTNKERRDSWIWLFAGGAFAICVALFAFWSDRTLSTSDSEHVLGQTIHEIRSVQVSFPSSVDPRQLGAIRAEDRLVVLEKEQAGK